MRPETPLARRRGRTLADVLLRLLVAAGLGLDAAVHAATADLYDGIGHLLSQGDLFRIEAGLACLVALFVLSTRSRAALVAAAVVSLSAAAALFASRYVDLGSLGPIPNMYEPAWDPQKSLALAGEIPAALASLAWLGLVRRGGPERKERRMRLTRSTALAGIGIAGALIAAGIAGGVEASTAASPARRPHANDAKVHQVNDVKVQHVTIVGNDQLRFVPSTVHLHAGKVRITLKDSGAYPHNLVIPALKFTSQSVTGDPGGTVVAFTVDFPHKGRYRFYCAYHQSAGMVGTFIVS